jgi:hypothetical protein
MTTPTNSHKAWTDKGGHVRVIGADGVGAECTWLICRTQRMAHGDWQGRSGSPAGCWA